MTDDGTDAGTDDGTDAGTDAGTESARREAWRRMRHLAHLPNHLDSVHRVLTEAGITPGVGKALAQIPLDQPIPMRDLAAALRCDNSYITSVVDTLELHGIAERQPHPSDRRIKVVRLTEPGILLAKKVREEMAQPPEVFDALSDRDAEALRDLLRKLTD